MTATQVLTATQECIEFLFQKNLCPLVSFPTLISGNILDQFLSNIADVASSDCCAHTVDFSDHFAVTLRFELHGVLKSNRRTETMTIPSSSFSDLKLIFSTALFSLTKTEDPLYTEFNQVLLPLFKRKRSKRLTYPSYYSSITVHYLNKLYTARKAHSESVTQLESDCDQFIELDTFLFINNFTCTGLQGCFKMIKLLNNTGDIPGFVLSQGTPVYKDTEIAEAFNDYFGTVYQPNITSTIDFYDNELKHVSFGRQEIENGLANASLGSGVYKLPGSFLRHATAPLSIHVSLPFSSILSSCVYPSN